MIEEIYGFRAGDKVLFNPHQHPSGRWARDKWIEGTIWIDSSGSYGVEISKEAAIELLDQLRFGLMIITKWTGWINNPACIKLIGVDGSSDEEL